VIDGINDRQRGILGHNPHSLPDPEIRINDSVPFSSEQWSSQFFAAQGEKLQQPPLTQITNFKVTIIY
jgi:hypothetical protein